MSYQEKIAAMFIYLENDSHKPVVLFNTEKFPLSYSFSLSIVLFNLSFEKQYCIKTSIFNDERVELMSALSTPIFYTESSIKDKDKIMANGKAYAGSFSLNTSLINYTEPGTYEIKVDLLSDNDVLDTAQTFFEIRQRKQ